ncbi:CLUMA_CG014583, isoform A [Clunio marinus]|uniref:CLUMA_CG014583, isoform A n=1 Tax=Clunio marinus TaxID=568069 RepID=A0A1J1IMN6_9DIPT|nr:CLUMA_CG014583, isoform A [Clunio marinus]
MEFSTYQAKWMRNFKTETQRFENLIQETKTKEKEGRKLQTDGTVTYFTNSSLNVLENFCNDEICMKDNDLNIAKVPPKQLNSNDENLFR